MLPDVSSTKSCVAIPGLQKKEIKPHHGYFYFWRGDDCWVDCISEALGKWQRQDLIFVSRILVHCSGKTDCNSFFWVSKFRNTMFPCLDLLVWWACIEAQGSNWMQNIYSICHPSPRLQNRSQNPAVWASSDRPNVTIATLPGEGSGRHQMCHCHHWNQGTSSS